MNTALKQRSPAVEAEVQYVAAPDRRLHCYIITPPDGAPESNADFTAHWVAIRDARRGDRPLCLDADGAAMIAHKSVVGEFYDADGICRSYYPEAAELIRAAIGAAEVVVFDHNVRRGGAIASADPYSPQRPVFHVHTDYTARSARYRAEAVLGRTIAPDERFAAINLWRPIAEPVQDCPLAICEAGSVATQDLVPVDLLYPDRTGEIYYVARNPAHHWYYAPEMRTDEAWLIKNYDSGGSAAARFTPHTAFVDPTAPRKVAPRESVEVRAIAVFAD